MWTKSEIRGTWTVGYSRFMYDVDHEEIIVNAPTKGYMGCFSRKEGHLGVTTKG
jgi:hypothetical protein